MTIGHDGTSNTISLPPGTYYVVETAAPKGWERDTNVYTVTVTSGNTTFVTSKEVPSKGYLTLKKSGSESTSYSLAGAKYTVYSNSSLTTSVGTLTTKADGTTNTLTLPPGTYYVKETEAPKGWKIDVMTHKVTVKSLATATVKSTENPQKGYVSIKKVIAENERLVKECPEQYTLAGAKYGIYTTKGGAEGDTPSRRVGYLTTKTDGTTNKLTLVVGTYYVKEVTAPKGFAIDPTVQTVTVKDNETTLVTSKENPAFDPMNIVLTKKDANGTGIPIADAEFTIKYYKELVDNVKGLMPKRTWVLKTDSLGRILLDESYKVSGDALYKNDDGAPVALIGTYEIYESKAPFGYTLSKEHFLRQVTQESNGSAVTVYNEPTINEYPQTVSIKVQKVDVETGEKVPQGYGTFEGAQYTVYSNAALTKPVGTITLNGKGNGTLVDLKPGKYYVKETKAPGGYVKNADIIEVDAYIKEINTANFEYSVISEEKPITTQVMKVDPDGKSIVGATLQIIDSKGNVVEEWVTTNEKHIVKGLAVGEYILHEAYTPPGYVTAKDVKFTIEAKEEIHEVAMIDDTIKVDIEKKDKNTKEFLAGAKLQLFDANGELVKEWVTDDKALRFDKLPKGIYTLKEIETLPGYVLAEDLTFEVLETGDVQTFTLENDFTKLEVIKTDLATGDIVEGAQLSIIPLDDEGNPKLGETWETFTTTTVPYKAYYIPQGNYILREVLAPFDQGYVTADDLHFTIKNTAEVQTIEMKNEHSKIKIKKIDKDTGEPISNTVLSLIPMDNEGNLNIRESFLTERTDENGEILSIYVPAGKYIIREDRPNIELGYVTAEDMKIEVIDTPEMQEFAIEDEHTKVEITKTDLFTGDVVEGAQLSIFPLDDEGNPKEGEAWDTFITGKDSYLCDYIPQGDYIIREISAPIEQGYVTAEDVKFTVKDTDEVQKVNMQEDHTKIKLRKIDKDGKTPISGTLLSLIPFDDEGNLMEGEPFLTEMTNDDGEIDVSYIPIGKYILREVIPNYDLGYIASADMEIEVLDTPNFQEYIMEDDYTKIKIRKVDKEKGKAIPRTLLSLIPIEEEDNLRLGKAILTDLTDENGEINITHVGLGKYIIREVMPNIEMGYVTAEDVVIEVMETGDIQEFLMEDSHTKVEISKIDIDTGEPVLGAVLQLLTFEGEVITEWISKKEPKCIAYLPVGKYWIKEIKAPEGYSIAEDVEVEVLDTDRTQSFSIENQRGHKAIDKKIPPTRYRKLMMPKTGDDAKLYVFVTIMVFSFIIIVFMILSKKAKKDKKI